MEIKTRFRKISVIAMVLLLAGVCRFFHLCVIKGKDYASAAEKQRVAGTELEPERGNIYDRNMVPFTNRKATMLSYTMPNSSVYNIHTKLRYDQESLARYVTGYVRKDGTGETGVEGFCEDYLKALGAREIVVVKDAFNKPLQGFGYTITEPEGKPYDVVLTLDYTIQKICEDIFQKHDLAGAFVMQEVATGDILAMGSFPEYQHGKIANYLYSEKGELNNRATASYSLGSVYKMVVAAAALENGFDMGYNYFCNGSIDVSGKDFKCHSHLLGGHGILSFQDAFAKSCNTFFIDLGLELGMEQLVKTGQLFGFGSKTGLNEQGIYESPGNLPKLEGTIYDRAIANVSIGQGEILATPLQVTNAVTAVANGGILQKPNVIDRIVDPEGKTVKKIKTEHTQRIIKESTAEKLREMMGEVAVSGTAEKAMKAYGLSGIYGKTGSAETGRYTEQGQIVHSWFSAFFSLGESQYTLTIFLENGVTLSQSSTEIFGEIVSALKNTTM